MACWTLSLDIHSSIHWKQRVVIRGNERCPPPALPRWDQSWVPTTTTNTSVASKLSTVECSMRHTHKKKAREKVSVFDVKNRMAAPGMHMHIAAVNDEEDVNLRIVPLYYI